ncbi:MAG: hypothetical protein R6U25_04100, partial [Alkalispirochaeta sp.]
AIDQLFALVQDHRPGQIITRTTLNISLGRGAAGRPSPDLMRLLEDAPQLSAVLSREVPLRKVAYRRGDGRFARRRWSTREPRSGVLDLNNLVWTFRHAAIAETPRIAPLFELVGYLRTLPVDHLVGIADANLRHTVGDPELLSELAPVLDAMHTAPAGVPADELILTAAEDAAAHGGALIYSNDRFRQWRKGSAWRRRNIWRILVPVRPPATGDQDSAERQFDLGDPGWELMDPPPPV